VLGFWQLCETQGFGEAMHVWHGWHVCLWPHHACAEIKWYLCSVEWFSGELSFQCADYWVCKMSFYICDYRQAKKGSGNNKVVHQMRSQESWSHELEYLWVDLGEVLMIDGQWLLKMEGVVENRGSHKCEFYYACCDLLRLTRIER